MSPARPPARRSTARKATAPVPAMLPPGSSYLQRILNARVYEVARETSLDAAPKLTRRLGNKVWLKREDEQDVFSFKLRGAYNKMAHLSAEQRAAGVICASAGNHAQGVALSAKKLGCRAVIVMPVTTPQVKVDAVRGHGGEVVLFGESFTDAFGHAKELEREQGLTFVHPFDDEAVMAGQGTAALELIDEVGHLDPAVLLAHGAEQQAEGVLRHGMRRIGRHPHHRHRHRRHLHQAERAVDGAEVHSDHQRREREAEAEAKAKRQAD